MKKEMVFYNGLSVYNGFIKTAIADIHTKKDIIKPKHEINKKQRKLK